MMFSKAPEEPAGKESASEYFSLPPRERIARMLGEVELAAHKAGKKAGDVRGRGKRKK